MSKYPKKRPNWQYYLNYGPKELINELKAYQKKWKLEHLDLWFEHLKQNKPKSENA